MSFNFRLQKLLEHREDQKKMAQEELARREQERMKVQSKLEKIETAQQRLLDFHRDQQAQGMDAFTLFSIDTYQSRLEQDYHTVRQKLHQSKNKVEKQREVVVEHWRQCRVLEKLKEKAWQEYIEEERLKEDRINDELALYCHMRNNNGPDFSEGGGISE